MLHALIYHGFPIKHRTSIAARNLFHNIINQIDLSFPSDKNLVIDGTWLTWDFQNICDAVISVYNPNKIWIGSIHDPWDMHDWAKHKFQNQEIRMFGHVPGRYGFNFWAIYCAEYFPIYDERDIWLNDQSNVFLCYQNKPRLHRQILAHKLISNNLENQGVLTLNQDQDSVYMYPTLKKRTIVPDQRLAQLTSGDDGTGVGDLEIWKNCFVNIVSETEMSDTSDVFISEKTWKPILGFRPFILNGDMRIYSYLRKHGFDVFDDIWPVQEMEQTLDLEKRIDIIVEIVKMLASKPKDLLKKQWLDLLPRLRYNHNRFFNFANEQKNIAYNLFENNNETTRS